nr:beta-ketoacyl synthase [Geobacteraceae bacterium]
MKSSRTEIVITGLAAISSAGVGLEPLNDMLKSGIPALRPVPVELAGGSGHFWGRAEGFKA